MRKLMIAALLGAILFAAGSVRAGESVRDRLVRVVAAMKDLQSKAEVLPEGAKNLGLEAVVPEDKSHENAKRFARESEVNAYIKIRPWSVPYRHWPEIHAIGAPENWPAPADAPALRELLNDKDPAIRSLAVEALGALDIPEDAQHIAALLQDQADAVPVLGWSQQISSQGWDSLDENPLNIERSWHARTVSTYVREALKLMTGHRFDGHDPQNTTFDQWWKRHEHGTTALWYWQQRLRRERQEIVFVEKKPGEDYHDYWERKQEASKPYRAKLHAATLRELDQLGDDVKAKIYFLTCEQLENVDPDGPANPYFPEGMQITLPAGKLKEMIANKDYWPESTDVEYARPMVLARLAKDIDKITAGYGAPFIYREQLAATIEKEESDTRWAAILVSRLKLPAENECYDDPKYREGYLRKALADAKEGYTRDAIAQEMVRENAEAQWPVLQKVFASEHTMEGSDARIGIIKGLGTEPHTPAKAKHLKELLDDPQNEPLFTQQNARMGMDQYRQQAAMSINAIAGKEIVDWTVVGSLANNGKASEAIAKLRAAAAEALAAVK